MPHRPPLLGLVLVVSSVLVSVAEAQAQRKVTVSAGASDRRDTIVPVQLSEDIPGTWVLWDQASNVTPLQMGPGGRGAFILGELKAGQTRSYRLGRMGQISADAPDTSVRASREGDMVKISSGGREILHYQGGKTPLPPGYEQHLHRGGYIHPVYTPGGKLVTDDYPPKHKHHHGIWSPWTKTQFEGRTPDFWNMFQKTGTVEFVRIGAEWSGPVAGGFMADHRMIDLSAKPQPKAAIDETWNVVVYRPVHSEQSGRKLFVFDFTTTQKCATDSPLVLPKYHYGGLGVRGHREWDGKDNCVFLTSEGKGRSNGNETTGKWCHVGGKVDGEMTGIAVLCHPENFRFPQPMRLHPDEPFFCYAPSQGGDWSIEPGKPYVARYRFVVADGPADKAEIERLWNDYANPPKVTVE
jgi:hypothetical protein